MIVASCTADCRVAGRELDDVSRVKACYIAELPVANCLNYWIDDKAKVCFRCTQVVRTVDVKDEDRDTPEGCPFMDKPCMLKT